MVLQSLGKWSSKSDRSQEDLAYLHASARHLLHGKASETAYSYFNSEMLTFQNSSSSGTAKELEAYAMAPKHMHRGLTLPQIKGCRRHQGTRVNKRNMIYSRTRRFFKSTTMRMTVMSFPSPAAHSDSKHFNVRCHMRSTAPTWVLRRYVNIRYQDMY